MLSYSALTNNGKVTLPSMESWGTNMNIIKDPPKSIMMRRIDKVGDSNEILNMIDNTDRSAESIKRFARGVNPSVSVNYSNFGGSQQNYGNKQAFLPYTINKDGDFRPPVKAPQDLLALSRLPRNITHATTNPGMPHNSKELDNSRNQTTTRTVKQDIISANVKATKTYYLQRPFQEPFEMSKNGIQDISNINVNSNINQKRNTELVVQEPTKGVNKDNLLVTNTKSNLQDIKQTMFDNDNINTNKYIQDTNAHSVYSNLGTKIDNGFAFDEDIFNLNNVKTKDYQLIEYTTPLSGNEKTEYIHENFELERNVPEYQTYTNTQGHSKISFIHDDIELEKNLPEYQSRTNTQGHSKISFIHDDLELERNMPEYQTFSNKLGNSKTLFIHEDLELERTMPEYQTFSNKLGNSKTTFIHGDIELERNMPEYQSQTNTVGTRKNVNFIHNDIELDRNLPQYENRTNNNGVKNGSSFIHKDLELEKNLPTYKSSTNNVGNAKVSFIHKNIHLDRNLPEYQTTSNIKFSGQKNIKPEHVRELERKAVLAQFSVNQKKNGEHNISNRQYNLEEKIQPGGFTNSGVIPVFNRTQEQHPKEKYESEKSKMSKNVMNQFSERYNR